jgi:hypothetical protein
MKSSTERYEMPNLKKILFLLLLIPFLLQAGNSCLVCHKGIEDIRDPNSKMMKEIFKDRFFYYSSSACTTLLESFKNILLMDDRIYLL